MDTNPNLAHPIGKEIVTVPPDNVAITWKDDESLEPDTCRICRGEATPGEPLFYPCKCSGSIKFVHQDCLMEWLSHSQKKHCELCKTPFRFTKLYSPDMPPKLPGHIFIRHVFIYTAKNIATWLRFCLVIMVWSGLLPWVMRHVWAFLFWVGDGGWFTGEAVSTHPLAASSLSTRVMSLLNGTCPNVVTLAYPTSNAAIGDMVHSIVHQTNSTTSSFLGWLYQSFYYFSSLAVSATFLGPVLRDTDSSHSTVESRCAQPSLLSNTKFLNQMTRFPRLNRTIITILEGQIITIVIVICFILVFLIREWVVQQQPGINMGAGFNAEFRAGNRMLPARDRGVNVDGGIVAAQGEARNRMDVNLAQIELLAARGPHHVLDLPAEADTHEFDEGQDEANFDTQEPDAEIPRIPAMQRPLAARDALSDAAEIQRRLTEGVSFSGDENGSSTATDNARVHEQNGVIADSISKSNDISALQEGVVESGRIESTNEWNLQQDVTAEHSQRLNFAAGDTNDIEEDYDSDTYDNDAGFIDNESHTSRDALYRPEENQEPHNDLPARTYDRQRADAPILVQPERRGLWQRVADWFYGDITGVADAEVADDEHVVRDIEAEAPFVPAAQRHNPHRPIHDLIDEEDEAVDDDPEAQQDMEVLEAARAAGVDPNDLDALDDAEDFEGIMELIGMRGPLAGLLQNALFSAVLISITLAFGVWIPYNFGRLVLLLLANPLASVKLPLRFMFSLAAVMQDFTLVVCGFSVYICSILFMLPMNLIRFCTSGLGSGSLGSSVAADAFNIAMESLDRIANGLLGVIVHLPDSEVPAFSAVSHEALIYLKDVISNSTRAIGSLVWQSTELTVGPTIDSGLDLANLKTVCLAYSHVVVQFLAAIPGYLAKSDSWVISLNMPARLVPVDPALSCWNGTDRFWAILSGYATFFLMGVAYVRKGSPFSSSQTGRDWEATVIDVLNQAGGVMKVILIISIEMLVFPLYCGLLLDMALLPLFATATIPSRLSFTIDTPFTSIFVHWFVGTCYMFHFALFVSMCRKIMRTGVLYFIRDPDDPTFHPVRDVLERNVMTQLRKITFSAMVYGALVVVCLGGVVWSLSYTLPGVLPIHWSSNEPVLEFPVDLLFYNFLMPLAIKVLKPTDGLQAIYTWWFEQCASYLRLSWFLFGNRRPEEEGEHIRTWWLDVVLFRTIVPPISQETGLPIVIEPFVVPGEGMNATRFGFKPNGQYVKVPGSDQVRPPKGSKVFQVAEEPERTAHLLAILKWQDLPEMNDGLRLVYIPPHFRLRIAVFVVLIWLFAATTGVAVTIVPLMFGRFLFTKIIPEHVQKNDIYAFSIGLYVLGGALYTAFCIGDYIYGIYCNLLQIYTFELYDRLWKLSDFRVMAVRDAIFSAVFVVKDTSIRVLRLVYFYTAFAIVLPVLAAIVVELYLFIPLHTYMSGAQYHVIHFTQSWTLGLLYIKLASRLILWYSDTRLAMAHQAVIRDGYLNPNIRVGTRCFIVPAILLFSTLILLPLGVATVAIRYQLFGSIDEDKAVLVYRYSALILLGISINMLIGHTLFGMLRGWRMRIRDEVYLIGERLHNFSDLRSKTAGLTAGGRELRRDVNHVW